VSTYAERLDELSSVARALDWQKFGACRNADDSEYYPDRGSRSRVSKAKATCAVCSVKDTCLEWAMARNEQHGVWGGLTRGERADLRRQRAAEQVAQTAAAGSTAAVCGTAASA
jgi:WhiB family redox-sensing transcriptional regulator